MDQLTNFSPTWFSVFLAHLPQARTLAEVNFVTRHCSRPQFSKLLDLCCGSGRHASELAARGYDVLGVDCSDHALSAAQHLASPRLRFRRLDMRDISVVSEEFDGVLSLWHSFGYFDDETNAAILGAVRGLLRPKGRLIIDLYNREHFLGLPKDEEGQRNGVLIRTSRQWAGNRLRVHVSYGAGENTDSFEWRIFTPAEFEVFAEAAGFEVLLSCAWFTESKPPSSGDALMQFVLQSRG